MKILFIKLGALGGVLRATPFFTGLKEKYSRGELGIEVKNRISEILDKAKLNWYKNL